MEKVKRPGMYNNYILNNYKQCNRCGKYKAKDEFQKNRAAPDGLYHICRWCNAKKTVDGKSVKKHQNVKFEPQQQLINYKLCTRCNEYFTLDSFYACNAHRSGLDSHCKLCKDKTVKKYSTSERGKEVSRKCGIKMRAKPDYQEKRDAYRAQPHAKKLEQIQGKKQRKTQVHKDWLEKYEKKPEIIIARSKRAKKYREANPEKSREACRQWKKSPAGQKWFKENKEILSEKKKEYNKINRKKRNDRQRKKRRNNPKIKLNSNISRAINASLKKGKECRSKWDVLPFTLEELMKHLEKQFTEKMSWSNYGKEGWNLDHKRPVASFNFETPENPDFKLCWSLDNLQPLWWKDNIKKSDKIDTPVQMSLLLVSKKGDKAGGAI